MDTRPIVGPGRRGASAARFGLPAIILLAALVAHVLVVDAGERRERAQVDAKAAAVAEGLERRVVAYGDVLYGVRGLFGASRHVTTAEFHASHAARAVEERYPGVKVVGYADLIAPRAIAGRTARVRRDTRASGLPYPRFAIHPAPAAGRRVAPITYLEPQAGNEPAFGLDFLSEPNRRAALAAHARLRAARGDRRPSG